MTRRLLLELFLKRLHETGALTTHPDHLQVAVNDTLKETR